MVVASGEYGWEGRWDHGRGRKEDEKGKGTNVNTHMTIPFVTSISL